MAKKIKKASRKKKPLPAKNKTSPKVKIKFLDTIQEEELPPDLPRILPEQAPSFEMMPPPIPESSVTENKPDPVTTRKKQTPKKYDNIDFFKESFNYFLGSLLRTFFGSLVVAGFVGLLQFVTTLANSGISLKHGILLVLVSFLVGTLFEGEK